MDHKGKNESTLYEQACFVLKLLRYVPKLRR